MDDEPHKSLAQVFCNRFVNLIQMQGVVKYLRKRQNHEFQVIYPHKRIFWIILY